MRDEWLNLLYFCYQYVIISVQFLKASNKKIELSQEVKYNLLSYQQLCPAGVFIS